jgi:hypothetical protein
MSPRPCHDLGILPTLVIQCLDNLTKSGRRNLLYSLLSHDENEGKVSSLETTEEMDARGILSL